MKTFEVKGISVHVEDEGLAKSIAESETAPSEIDEKDAEVLLKELEEWLASGRSQVLNKAQKELRKQFMNWGDAASPYGPQLSVPAGARVGSTQAASGVVVAPNVWTGGPQAQAAAQQIAIGSLVEEIANKLSLVLQDFAAQLAQWVSSVAKGLFDTIENVAERIAEAQRELGDELREVSENLKAVADKLPEGTAEAPSSLLPEVSEEALPPVEEEVTEEAPPGPEGGGVGEVGEVAGSPEEEGASPTPPGPPKRPEEEAKAVVAPTPDITTAVFSPQFLAAFARHLSQLTKEVIDAQTRKANPEPYTVKPQSALEIADVIASSLRKSVQAKGNVETDLTAPVTTAAPPEGKGVEVSEQVKGASKDEAIRAPLKEAKKSADKEKGDDRS
jgi:gas vesicle protein